MPSHVYRDSSFLIRSVKNMEQGKQATNKKQSKWQKNNRHKDPPSRSFYVYYQLHSVLVILYDMYDVSKFHLGTRAKTYVFFRLVAYKQNDQVFKNLLILTKTKKTSANNLYAFNVFYEIISIVHHRCLRQLKTF